MFRIYRKRGGGVLAPCIGGMCRDSARSTHGANVFCFCATGSDVFWVRPFYFSYFSSDGNIFPTLLFNIYKGRRCIVCSLRECRTISGLKGNGFLKQLSLFICQNPILGNGSASSSQVLQNGNRARRRSIHSGRYLSCRRNLGIIRSICPSKPGWDAKREKIVPL